MLNNEHGTNSYRNPASSDVKSKEIRVVSAIIEKSSREEQEIILDWASGLLEIKRNKDALRKKAQAALMLTAQKKIVWPMVKLIATELKGATWDDRSITARFGLAGATAGLAFFGGQGAGIAALGGAIGVPLWIVFGAGGTFAGLIVDELTKHLQRERN